MKTKEQILEAVRNENGWERDNCEILESRDYVRLVKYFPVSEWEKFGMQLKDGAEAPEVKDWNETNIIADMLSDLEFAISKAEGQRGISASLMFDVMRMWMWVLEDELSEWTSYYDYGLPFFTEIQEKYEPSQPEAPVTQNDTNE